MPSDRPGDGVDNLQDSGSDFEELWKKHDTKQQKEDTDGDRHERSNIHSNNRNKTYRDRSSGGLNRVLINPRRGGR